MMSKSVKSIQEERIGLVTICLGLYFCMMPFDSFPVFGAATLLPLLSLLPIAAVIVVNRRQLVFRLDILSFAVILYLLSIGLTCIYSIYPDYSFSNFKRVALNLALVLVVGSMHLTYNRREISFLKGCLILGGIFTAGLTLLFSYRNIDGRLTIRVNGVVQDQNYLNGYMFFAYVYFLIRFFKEKKLKFLLPCAGFLAFNLMTGSRGALLSYAIITATVVYSLAFKRGKANFGILIAVLLLLVLIAMNYQLILSLLPENVAQRFSIDYIKQHGSTGRVMIWRVLLKRFVDAGTFKTFFGFGYATTVYLNYYNYMPAHNVLVDHVVMGGIFGLIIYIFFHGVFVYQAVKSKDLFLVAAYTGYLTMMMSLSLWSYKPIWNLMMLIVITIHRNKQELRKKAMEEAKEREEAEEKAEPHENAQALGNAGA